MAKIYVHTPFELQHGPEKLVFGVGVHEVAAEVADHWYARHFIGDDPGGVQSEDSQAVDALLVELDGREQELRKQLELLEAEKTALADREKAAADREAAVTIAEEAAKTKASELDQREADLADREKAAAETKTEGTKNSKK